jgi:site-specific DNA-methyltransferase (adenine-specific)
MAKRHANPRHLWQAAPRRWGDRLHRMCSYMAMFPPSIPHVFIRWLTDPGDVVYDPFSGRGTTALEACLEGRRGYGSDLNPLALVLSRAKVAPPSLEGALARLAELEAQREVWDSSAEPESIRMLFDPGTLGELLWMKHVLDVEKPVDRFFLAALLGILHANANARGEPRGLTVSMPNTFSMSPGYVAKYIAEHRLVPPQVSPLVKLRARVEELLNRPYGHTGAAWKRDATGSLSGPVRRAPAKLLFTSPPYLHVIKYGKLNWIRLWLLGESPREVDDKLFGSSSLPKYVEFMRKALQANVEAVREDGFVCLVIGDVRNGDEDLNLAQAVADSCVSGTGLTVRRIVNDSLPVHHKVSRIWKDTKGRATKTDRVVVLARRRAPRLASLPQVAWN